MGGGVGSIRVRSEDIDRSPCAISASAKFV